MMVDDVGQQLLAEQAEPAAVEQALVEVPPKNSGLANNPITASRRARRKAAADLHDRPRARGHGVDPVQQPCRQVGVGELVEILHGSSSICRAAAANGSPNSSCISPSRSNSASDSSAERSSSRWMANPTCTIT